VSTDGWGRPAQQAVLIIAIILSIGSLHFARSAIVPVLFAIFLALLLSPAVNALARLRVPRALGAAIVMVSLVATVALALNATWRPARGWLETAPTTLRTLERKLRPVTRLIAKVESVSQQAGRVTDLSAAAEDVQGPPAPAIPDKTAMQNTQDWLIATVTMLIVTYFLLAGGPSMLVRLGAAWSGGATGTRLLQLATTISEDLGRYFATVTLSNLLLGLATTATMHWLGMPNPLLWGGVAFLLNYVPYAGSAVTFTLLTVVALVSFDGLGKAFAVAGTYLALTTIEGQIVQPVLVGRRLDVHPLVVLLSLWFGGWLWGIAGVALAMPLIVTAKALAIELGAQTGSAAIGTPGATTIRSRAEELLTHGAVSHRRSEPERR
jgi:predicted PurR-regulated permease PerM